MSRQGTALPCLPTFPGPLCPATGSGLTGRISMSHMPMLVVTTWPTPNMVFPDKPCRERRCGLWALCLLSSDPCDPSQLPPHLSMGRPQPAPPTPVPSSQPNLDIGGIKQALRDAEPLSTIVCVVAIGHFVMHCGHLRSHPAQEAAKVCLGCLQRTRGTP